MISKNKKHIFFQRDDTFSLIFNTPSIKRNAQYITTFKKEYKLRNRSTPKKRKSNNYFDLNHALLCQLLCRKKCSLEDFKTRKIPTPIEGLNCDKVNYFLYASQRLSNQLIKKYDLIKKLKESNVGLIVNCEEKGEHPFCSTPYTDGLDPNGFGYSFIDLEKNGINVLRCGWKDFFAPESFHHMIKIVKKMYYYIHTLKKGILVHCHAGFGRTAITLACYLMFEKKINAEEARKMVRKGQRARCLGGDVQFHYCQEFEEYLDITRKNFFEKNRKDITIFKINEKILDIGEFKFLHFNDNKYKEYVPLFLLYIFDRIIQIKIEKKLDSKSLINSLIDKELNKDEEINMNNLIKDINKHNWDSINNCQDLKLLGKLLFKWLHNSINYIINPADILSFDETNYSLGFETLNNSTKINIQCISKFLLVIDENWNENKDIKKFIGAFIPALLGYSSLESNDQIKHKNIEKLLHLFSFSNKK